MKLDTWRVEYLDVLLDIPESVRKEPPLFEYKPPPWATTRDSGRGKAKVTGSKEGGAPRPYCTMKCIHGLVNGGRLDLTCPNVKDHGSSETHHCLSAGEFTQRLHAQLYENPEKDIELLHICGRTGFLLKATLTSHSYTITIKATTADQAFRLHHKARFYSHLHPLQGSHIPVYVGDFTPQVPCYYHSK